MRLVVVMAALALCAPVPVAAQDTGTTPWDPEIWDPAGGADLILPMPCGGFMTFQKVAIPMDVENPLADRAFRMGQSQADTGYSDYLTPTFLRGAFDDVSAGVSYYYIARYELTQGQYRALNGDCAAPFTLRDRFAEGGLSWFDAVDLTRRYTEWLLGHAPDSLPSQNDRVAFLRLPTEAEWEFAARGGVRIDPTLFPARRFFADGDLGDYANYQAAGQGRGKLRPIGLRKPNPLGLFDIYGNAEELMLDPFRLNAVGRPHGQAGGIVTRGGSIDSDEAQIYTAQRREYPDFNPRTGKAQAGEFFGLRPVISAHVVTDAGFSAIKDRWQEEAEGKAEADADPLATLSSLLEQEVDPRRQDVLSGLQLDFRVARDQAQASLLQAAQSTLLSGAAFVGDLLDDAHSISLLESAIGTLKDRVQITVQAQTRLQLMMALRGNVERLTELRAGQNTSLLFYRNTLETLINNVSEELRQTAFLALGRDLAASGQTDLLNNLNRFWGDVSAYAGKPDMSQDDLLIMALQ